MERKLPAYPIFIKDPNFSIWSETDALNTSNVKTWFGEEKKIYGFVKIQNVTYCFMGNAKDYEEIGVIPAQQVSVDVSLFATEYLFLCGKQYLKLRFVSPLPLNNLDLLSLPVTYIEYELDCDGEISIFVNRNIAYNNHTQERLSRGMSLDMEGYQVAFVGLKRQLPLSNNDDVVGADWGYYYLSGEKALPLDENALKTYLENGKVEYQLENEEIYISSINQSRQGMIMLGYDDRVSIDYFGEYLKGYYLENHTIFDALNYVFSNKKKITDELEKFEYDLLKRAEVFGKEYVAIINAAYRQTIGAHKLVRDKNGKILFLSKECGSNGCIATVDVTYPSMPLFLLYNTELVKGMLRPIFKFAKMPVWGYDFAPHDVGTYPHCSGQVYGLNVEKNQFHGNYAKDGGFQTHFPLYLLPSHFDAYNLDRQMPVEECADILIALYACYRKDKDAVFFRENFELCKKWVRYLVEFGLKPDNQLCTDDFAGHLKNNINLAIKATVAIGCYAELLKTVSQKGDDYRKIAEEYAKEIADFSMHKGHLPISWDSDVDTFSLKYNLAFDKILKLNLFDEKVYENEILVYKEKVGKYGVPLDNRAVYTKSDWLIWTSYFAPEEDRTEYLKTVYNFLIESPDRVPFSDWYDTDTGKIHFFRARSVQGGCFILLLK